jgi:hypothetical protein
VFLFLVIQRALKKYLVYASDALCEQVEAPSENVSTTVELVEVDTCREVNRCNF